MSTLVKRSRIRCKIQQISAICSALIALILGENSPKGHKVTKVVTEIKFERVWGELESKKAFQRQPVTKSLRLTLAFK